MNHKHISQLGFLLFIGGLLDFISYLGIILYLGTATDSTLSKNTLIIGSILTALGVLCLAGGHLLSPKEREKPVGPPQPRKNFFENISREKVVPPSKKTPQKTSAAVNYTRPSFINWEELALRNEPEFQKMPKTLQTYKPIVPTLIPIVPTLKDTPKPKTETPKKPTEANNATPLTVDIENVPTSWFLQTCGISYAPPSHHDFGISDKELALYEELGKWRQQQSNRKDNLMSYCALGSILVSWLLMFFSLAIPDLKSYVQNLQGIMHYISVGIAIGCIPLPFFAFLNPLLWLSWGVVYLCIKITQSKPPLSELQEKKVKAYLKAKEDFTKKHTFHKTLANYDYKIENYVSAYAIPKFIERVKTFVERENRDIKKENLRADQNFWFRLDPYEFEKEVARWFRAQGYKAEVTSKTGDGGIDIKLTHPTEGILYVQCKRYCTQKVDRPTLQQLYGAICADASQGVTGGAIVCLVGLSTAAIDFARKVGIRVYTIHDLAPEDSLFEQRVQKDLLDTSLRQLAPLEYRIGNITISAICYLDKGAMTFQPTSLHHAIDYHRVYFVIKCLPDVFEKFK